MQDIFGDKSTQEITKLYTLCI